MLVLTRKEEEGISIFIHEKKILNFTVVKLSKKRIWLRFEANDEVFIIRDELISKSKGVIKLRDKNQLTNQSMIHQPHHRIGNM